jgi:hypothetical protein
VPFRTPAAQPEPKYPVSVVGVAFCTQTINGGKSRIRRSERPGVRPTRPSGRSGDRAVGRVRLAFGLLWETRWPTLTCSTTRQQSSFV